MAIEVKSHRFSLMQCRKDALEWCQEIEPIVIGESRAVAVAYETIGSIDEFPTVTVTYKILPNSEVRNVSN